MSQELLRSLVWTDYRLAVLVTVVVPLILLIWSTVKQSEAIQRLMLIYWRVASLLGITVYLLIGSLQIGFVAGLMASVLIPISLWFWLDLNEDIDDQPQKPLKLVFTAWRWAVSVFSGVGAIATLPTLRCAFSREAFTQPFCQVWLDPPFLYKEIFHRNTTPGFLAFLGVVGLVIYVLYLIYFVFVRLSKQGRTAVEQ